MKHKDLLLLSNLLCIMRIKKLSGIIVAQSVKINKKTSRSFISVTPVPHNKSVSTNVRFWHKADVQNNT